MDKKDIRWQQRFENYKKALNQLLNANDLYHLRPLSDLEKLHTYNEDKSATIIKNITTLYVPCFIKLYKKMQTLMV